MRWFLKQFNATIVRPLGKGHASFTYLVALPNHGKKIVVKAEKKPSKRMAMVEKESQHLLEANALGVGPTLLGHSVEHRLIWMEFIEGKTLKEWVLEPRSSGEWNRLVHELFRQAKLLDGAGLDHGQLAGSGKNIIVRSNGMPCIIDFEKASGVRKPHNENQLKSFLIESPHGKMARCVRTAIG